MNGLKIQWIIAKTITSGDTGTVVSFPIQFSSANSYAMVQGNGLDSTNNNGYAKNYTASSVQIFTGNRYGTSTHFVFIGY